MISKCEKCLYYKTKQECDLCNRLSSVVDNYPAFTPNTNYDRIRNMSIEEMAEFLESTNNVMAIKLGGEYIVRAKEYIKIWLESEVTE